MPKGTPRSGTRPRKSEIVQVALFPIELVVLEKHLRTRSDVVLSEDGVVLLSPSIRAMLMNTARGKAEG